MPPISVQMHRRVVFILLPGQGVHVAEYFLQVGRGEFGGFWDSGALFSAVGLLSWGCHFVVFVFCCLGGGILFLLFGRVRVFFLFGGAGEVA